MKLNVKLFADGADKDGMLEMYANPSISGFTTNPTLMKVAGVDNYKTFAQDILSNINDKPISFEVFSDDFIEMEKQGLEIASWSENVNVKIPITNTKGISTKEVINNLNKDGIKLNVTAIFTVEQVLEIMNCFDNSTNAIISVFAGRIADSGVDPMETMIKCSEVISSKKNVELLWASSREILNIFQAEESNSNIITIAPDILEKIKFLNKNLNKFSLDTVNDFFKDASSAGFNILEKDS